MGVYIPNMEMPTSCEKCPFLDYEEGFCFASGVKGKSGWYESTLCPGGIKDGRHDECPLVPMTKHGRLIDADALLKSYEISPHPTDCHGCLHEDEFNCGGSEWSLLCEAVTDAPTIVPAE